MNKETLHLWCAYPDDLLDEETASACARLLSEDELARWQRYKFDRNRREYLATHALARTALSYRYALAPEAWRFQLNDYGKPSIDQECDLRFNLSNSTGLVVCLVGMGAEVGVDVEPLARAKSILDLGPRVFSPRERAQLAELCEDERPERALRLWTLKEAYIKARGMGLALPLNKFSFVFDRSNGIRMEMDADFGDDPGRWRFCLLKHAAHCIALMIESRAAPELQIWEARPPFAGPRRLELEKDVWFPGL
jgi:4'-phosphopantetheinyl transferase